LKPALVPLELTMSISKYNISFDIVGLLMPIHIQQLLCISSRFLLKLSVCRALYRGHHTIQPYSLTQDTVGDDVRDTSRSHHWTNKLCTIHPDGPCVCCSRRSRAMRGLDDMWKHR
jgi:hypothetical protein